MESELTEPTSSGQTSFPVSGDDFSFFSTDVLSPFPSSDLSPSGSTSDVFTDFSMISSSTDSVDTPKTTKGIDDSDIVVQCTKAYEMLGSVMLENESTNQIGFDEQRIPSDFSCSDDQVDSAFEDSAGQFSGSGISDSSGGASPHSPASFNSLSSSDSSIHVDISSFHSLSPPPVSESKQESSSPPSSDTKTVFSTKATFVPSAAFLMRQNHKSTSSPSVSPVASPSPTGKTTKTSDKAQKTAWTIPTPEKTFSPMSTSPSRGSSPFTSSSGKLKGSQVPDFSEVETPPSGDIDDYLYDYRNRLSKECLESGDVNVFQDIAEKGTEADIDFIFNETLDDMSSLMCHHHANYLCQSLFRRLNEHQFCAVVDRIAPEMESIACDMYGTRALQKFVEFIDTPREFYLFRQALTPCLFHLALDGNGSHVIQRCIMKFTEDQSSFIFTKLSEKDYIIRISTDRQGCCTMQRLLDAATPVQRIGIVQSVLDNVLELVQDAFGNYVVQHILNNVKEENFARNITRALSGNFVMLSTQKFSSNVVESLLRSREQEVVSYILDELVTQGDMVTLLQDPFANYVIQTALNNADEHHFNRLSDAIIPHSKILRNTLSGKKILSIIYPDYPSGMYNRGYHSSSSDDRYFYSDQSGLNQSFGWM